MAVFNNTVVWLVSTRPLTLKSSKPFSNPLVTVPITITIGIIVTFMFLSSFQSYSKVKVLYYYYYYYYYFTSCKIVFHWNLRDSNLFFKSPLLFSIFYPILAMFWSFSKSFQEHQLHCHYTDFLLLLQDPTICKFFRSLDFSSVVNRTGKLFNIIFLLVNQHYFWSSSQNLVIHLYLKIPENYKRQIFLESFRLVHVAFVNIVKL